MKQFLYVRTLIYLFQIKKPTQQRLFTKQIHNDNPNSRLHPIRKKYTRTNNN